MNKLASVQLGDDEEGGGGREGYASRAKGRVGRQGGAILENAIPGDPPRRKRGKGTRVAERRFFCSCVAFHLGHPCF